MRTLRAPFSSRPSVTWHARKKLNKDTLTIAMIYSRIARIIYCTATRTHLGSPRFTHIHQAVASTQLHLVLELLSKLEVTESIDHATCAFSNTTTLCNHRLLPKLWHRNYTKAR